jgi:hypothetical protein
MKTLVAGWFSFDRGHATAGDLLARILHVNGCYRPAISTISLLRHHFTTGLVNKLWAKDAIRRLYLYATLKEASWRQNFWSVLAGIV